MLRCGVYSTGSRYVPMADSCEHGNELPDSIKAEEFLDQLRNHELLMKDSSPWS
jgi:hypothetical protein